MSARRRASPSVAAQNGRQISDEVRPQGPVPGDGSPIIAPPKLGLIFSVSAAFYISFFYLVFYHYDVEPDLRRSIAINAAMSFGGFVVVVRFIPVTAGYLLKRNMFGYDINKKGTPEGTTKVPESLGIVTGIVYLVVTIIFQHFNFESDSNMPDVGGEWAPVTAAAHRCPLLPSLSRESLRLADPGPIWSDIVTPSTQRAFGPF